jgi:two-component system sensor kinase FixL
MSWVTVVWSIGSGGCLTLALMHFVVWWKDRAARANLVFSVMSIAVVAFAALELAMMRAETPAQFGMAVRWMHVPAWVIIASLVGFVRLYLKAGRPWLAWTIVGVRTFSLILNFVFSSNINYREITALRHIPFLGESVSVAEGVANPWMLVAQFSLLLLLIFVTDATVTVWRRGNRRQALMVGGSIVLLVVGASVEAVVITWGIIPIPMTASLFYQGLVAVMACELSYDVLRAAQITQRLQASDFLDARHVQIARVSAKAITRNPKIDV